MVETTNQVQIHCKWWLVVVSMENHPVVFP